MLFLVLGCEILFYTLYMYVINRKDLLKYLVIFTIATGVVFLLEKVKILAYLGFVLITLIGMAIIKNNKSSNILKVLVMLLYKLGIELIFSFLMYYLIKDVLMASVLVGIIKMYTTLLLSKVLLKMNEKIEVLWEKNNFYIRYITAVFLMMYIVATCIYLIQYWI